MLAYPNFFAKTSNGQKSHCIQYSRGLMLVFRCLTRYETHAGLLVQNNFLKRSREKFEPQKTGRDLRVRIHDFRKRRSKIHHILRILVV